MSKDGQVARAKKDLARALHIEESEIAVQSVQETDWPDASLGLGKPGQMYAQMLVSGYLIELRAQGRTYSYHCDDSSRVERA